MATYVSDTFTDTAGVAITSHVGETGATWAYNTANAASFVISNANRVRPNATGNGYAYASGSPATADYEVSALIRKLSSVGTATNIGIVGRSSTGVATFYYAHYNDGAAQWQLARLVTGGNSTLGSYAQALTLNQDYKLTLRMVGTAISLYVDDVLRVGPITNAEISQIGKAGIKCGGSTATATDSTGYHIDSLTVTDIPAAPANTVAPVASGTGTVGQTLSCTTGTWTGEPTPTFAYQWKRDGVNIGGATSSTYLLVSGDAGTTVTCTVTGTNAGGSASATSNGIAVSAAVTASRVVRLGGTRRGIGLVGGLRLGR